MLAVQAAPAADTTLRDEFEANSGYDYTKLTLVALENEAGHPMDGAQPYLDKLVTAVRDVALTGGLPMDPTPPEETVDGAVLVLPRRAGETIRDMRAVDVLSVALEAAKGPWLRYGAARYKRNGTECGAAPCRCSAVVMAGVLSVQIH
jgi:hypothetical protein